ncbi:anti-sigma factor family protein [Amycolatopsis thermoflava]|uniref:Putative zinc finger protein n=1 Tax=Amycolatopsis thermoflava TaxID=84480 RepID=A0A3N2H6P1_9PSEU|nr:zf-HC2 domain-containing protein [Amycolatopsis thermoflava]ROS43785.1 putative zinc finger protein [Amycolatopsis thermoflava]
MTEPDEFVTYDAAYVLGALSPEDRAAYEEHLRGCAQCSAAVAELAGLPGLLSQVTPDMVEGEPPPDRLLPALLRGVRRARRRRVLTTFGVAVAAAAAVLAAMFVPQSDGGGGTAMTPLGAYPVQATAAVASVSGGGSRVDMSCSYRGAYEGAGYLLVAIRSDGTEAPLATWNATPDRDARISVGTDLPPEEIKALEIRTTSGVPLLRWHP